MRTNSNKAGEQEYDYSHDRFNLLGPVGPMCKLPLEKYGGGDLEKRACGLQQLQHSKLFSGDCVVFSVGGNNQWDFELNVAQSTDCKIHTFDCTVDGVVPNNIKSKTSFHKVCLGDKDETIDGKTFLSWESLLSAVNVSSSPTYLKMDIEGYEIPVMRSIIDSGKDLPLQIAMELHLTKMSDNYVRMRSSAEIMAFMNYIHDFGGYMMIDRNDNNFCPHCSELLLVRVDCTRGNEEVIASRSPLFENAAKQPAKFDTALQNLKKRMKEHDNAVHSNDHSDHLGKMTSAEVHLAQLKVGCGDICETSMQGSPSLFFPEVRKRVDCTGIWGNTHIDDGRPPGPPPLVPAEMMSHFNYGGRIKFRQQHIHNNMYLGADAKVNIWNEDYVEDMKKKCSDGTLDGTYGKEETARLKKGIDFMKNHILGGRVLVIGSENPWVEACVLAAGAANVTTLEYGFIQSTHPQIIAYTPNKMRELYLSNQLQQFDAVVTFSSVEHSGLGRYGDALNPWGDLQTLARAWCVSKPEAALILGVPGIEFENPGDSIDFNGHRVYGPVMYSQLFANWKQLWRGDCPRAGCQRVYALTKFMP